MNAEDTAMMRSFFIFLRLFYKVNYSQRLEKIIPRTPSARRRFLEETQKRFGKIIRQLELVKLDINSSNLFLVNTNFIWAALTFEYVSAERCFEFINLNTDRFSTLVITLQSNNGVRTVSNTGVESIQLVSSVFQIVDKDNLQKEALKFGFECVGFEENFLPNGKSLLTYEFSKESI